MKILQERETLNNKQKKREEQWERDNSKLDVKFEELEKETKRFLTKRMKYIGVEEKAYADRKAMRMSQMKKLKAQLVDTRARIQQFKDDPSRSQDLTQSRIEEDQYEQRLAELEAED